jgi:lipoprotein-releasing system permease protein
MLIFFAKPEAITKLLGVVFSSVKLPSFSLVARLSSMFSSINHLPISFNKSFYISGLSFGILTAFLSSYIPARKAARIDPVYIIRG